MFYRRNSALLDLGFSFFYDSLSQEGFFELLLYFLLHLLPSSLLPTCILHTFCYLRLCCINFLPSIFWHRLKLYRYAVWFATESHLLWHHIQNIERFKIGRFEEFSKNYSLGLCYWLMSSWHVMLSFRLPN